MRKERRERLKRRKRRIKRITLFIILVIIVIIRVNINKKDNEVIETSAEIINEVTEENNKEVPEIDSKLSDWELILVNRDNKLSDDYKFDLQTIETSNHKADSRIIKSLTQMLEDARKEGLYPLICSSYRPYSTQKKLYNQKVEDYLKQGYIKSEAEDKASYWVAIPGTSEHQTGLALDIVDRNYQLLNEEQEDTPVQKWLIDNSYKYGFTLRYPTDKKEITKINYEPWHYRYVGVKNATFMKEKGYCLEEYIEYLKKFN